MTRGRSTAPPAGAGLLLDRLAHPAVHDIGFLLGADAEALGELRVGHGRIGVDGLAVLADALGHVAGAEEQPGVEEIGAGRRFVGAEHVLDDDERLGVFAQLVVRLGQAELDRGAVRRQGQGAAVFLFGLVERD